MLGARVRGSTRTGGFKSALVKDPSGGKGGVGGLNTYDKDVIRPILGSIVPYPPSTDFAWV